MYIYIKSEYNRVLVVACDVVVVVDKVVAAISNVKRYI